MNTSTLMHNVQFIIGYLVKGSREKNEKEPILSFVISLLMELSASDTLHVGLHIDNRVLILMRTIAKSVVRTSVAHTPNLGSG